MEILFTLATALLVGLLLSRVALRLHLPAVTAYLITGIIIGPFCLGAIGINGLGFTESTVDSFKIISDVALGFIAFSIGNEFRLSQLKSIGKQATIIGILQAVITTIVVDVALIALSFIIPNNQFPLPAAIIMGAIASATAPAATLMVVKQYRAKGPVTDTLLPVVAIDDAVGLVLFAVSFGIAKAMMTGAVSIVSILLEPIIEVALSLLLGAVMGYVFSFSERFFHSRAKRLSISVAFVLFTVAISMIKFNIGGVHFAFSPLLACMMLGTIFCNVCDFSAELMDRMDRWTAPIFILFFVISGAELDLAVFTQPIVVIIGVVYIAFRCVGKYFGARSSATLVHSEPNIRKYLGITLFPQAGVALGMAAMAIAATKGTEYAQVGMLVSNLTLFSVLVYEIFGPFLTKMALTKAGEIKLEDQVSDRGSTIKEIPASAKEEKVVAKDETNSEVVQQESAQTSASK